jgi:hypothetical protein
VPRNLSTTDRPLEQRSSTCHRADSDCFRCRTEPDCSRWTCVRDAARGWHAPMPHAAHCAGAPTMIDRWHLNLALIMFPGAILAGATIPQSLSGDRRNRARAWETCPNFRGHQIFSECSGSWISRSGFSGDYRSSVLFTLRTLAIDSSQRAAVHGRCQPEPTSVSRGGGQSNSA